MILHVDVSVRYWEDAVVNGIEDEKGDLIPCRHGDSWKPIIDVDSGRVINWQIGVDADIHYKVCDAGTYQLTDGFGGECIKDGYVPDIMSPKENGCGDYIIMNIDSRGIIEDWKPNLINDFISECIINE